MVKHIAFDFDGVIADTFDFHRIQVQRLYDVILEPQEYRDMHDGNFYESKNTKLAGVDFHGYGDAVGPAQAGTTPFPGAIAAIKDIAKSTKVSLVTSGWEVQILPFLQHHKITDCFAHILCADAGLAKHDKLNNILEREVLDTHDLLFVTDTLGDLREASFVQVKTLAVTFGFHQREHLEKGKPDFFADSWQEIISIIESH